MKLWWFGKDVWTSNRNITVPEDAWQIATCFGKQNSPFFSAVFEADKKTEYEWLIVNLSTHRVPVTGDGKHNEHMEMTLSRYNV
jgi:hypothetical protein